MKIRFHVITILFSVGFLLDAHAETYTYPQLVKRLTDLEHLSEVPPAGEKTALASSYDRASQYDAANDKYLKWDANDDGKGIIRKEGDESVIAEIQGPGCIWRTWSATPKAGHVKMYLDGSDTPVVDLPFTGYFDRKNEPFTRPNLVYKTNAEGWNNYTPIPFQKSCKIVADDNWGEFYQFTYTQFPPDTVVPTFKLPLAAEDNAALDEANAIWGKCGDDPAGARPDQKIEKNTVTVQPGESATVADLAGPEAITALRCQLEKMPKGMNDQMVLLRQLALHITWDDQKTEAVWSPLGDFFGEGAGAWPHLSLTGGLTDKMQFYSYWYMPFASHALLTVSNDGPKPVTMTWEFAHAPLTKPIASLLRFHAKWHRDAFLPDRPDRAIDWTLLTTQGKGRYVGTQLHIWSHTKGWAWWGEGDEKFFIDGEKFPSTFGTGSEDYFGFAWCTPTAFVQALHGQPINQGNSGHASEHRSHVPDSLPFQQSFDGYIEKYFPNSKPTFYAAVAYWYLSPDGKDHYLPQSVSDRVDYLGINTSPAQAGLTEGEDLTILTQQPPSSVETQDMTEQKGGKWSGNNQLWWKPTAVGNKLELELPVDKAGKYHLTCVCTKAVDYGTFQAAVDGTNAGDPIDLYNASVIPSDPIDLGVLDLTAGKHILSFEVTGKNASATGYLFGLDYIKLAPGQ